MNISRVNITNAMKPFQPFDWFKKLFHMKSRMNSYNCGICGKVHDGLPMDIAYKNPVGLFNIPPNERSARISKTDDVCVIDDREFYVRGVLPIPIIDSDDEFRWGVWVRVGKDDFKTYLEYWDGNVPENLPALKGCLSGGIKNYPDSDMIEIEIVLQSDNQRPIFRVISNENQLGLDQQNGITMEKVHSFVFQLQK